jgi:hypothetical protein
MFSKSKTSKLKHPHLAPHCEIEINPTLDPNNHTTTQTLSKAQEKQTPSSPKLLANKSLPLSIQPINQAQGKNQFSLINSERARGWRTHTTAA